MEILESYERNGVTVNILFDDYADNDNPEDWGNYEIVLRKDIDTDDDGNMIPELKAKLTDGRAFWIDKFEHGQVAYTLYDDGRGDRWDTSFRYGLIVFTDEYASNHDDIEGRREMAQSDLETYTAWANGEVYRYDIEDDGETVEACGGFIGDIEYCKQAANEDADAYRIPRRNNPASRVHL